MSNEQWWTSDYVECESVDHATESYQQHEAAEPQGSAPFEDEWWRDDTNTPSDDPKPGKSEGTPPYRSEEPFDDEEKTGDDYVGQKMNCDVQKTEIDLPTPEKCKLLQLLSSSRKLKLDSGIRLEVDVDNMKAVLVGEGSIADGLAERMMDNKISVLAAISSAVSGLVDLSTGVAKLLLTERGERWLAERLSQYHVIGVVFVSFDRVQAIAADDQTLSDFRKHLTKWLKTDEKQFGIGHVKYLQSSKWKETADNIEYSRFVKVTVDYARKCVVVDGCSDDVDNTVAEIDAVLKVADSSGLTMQLKRNEIVVLYYHRNDIEEYIKTNMAGDLLDHGEPPVRIDFDYNSNCLKLSGSTVGVGELENYINSEYIDKLTSDTFDVDLPGLTPEDFDDRANDLTATQATNDGYKTVHFVQTQFKCNVSVTFRSVECHKVTSIRRRHADRTASPAVAADTGFYSPSSDSGGFQSPPSTPSATKPKCSLHVEEGKLSSFQADVVVHPISTSRPDWTKVGPITKELLDAVGDALKSDLESNWPKEFGKDVIATSSGGNTRAKKIYTVAVNVYKDDSSIKLMESLITSCLDQAINEGMTSIAFPAIGCGQFLKYSYDHVASCFVRAEQSYGRKIKISIVVLDSRTKRYFQTAINKAVESVVPDPASSVSSTPVIPDASTSSGSPSVDSTPARSSSTTSVPSIEVVLGSLAEFDKADVLVNIIAANTRKLAKAGRVSLSLSEAGGPELQQEFENQEQPVNFGTDVAVTAAYGSLKAKKIYHAAMRSYRDEQSATLLYRMISKCLQLAADDQMASIAFPTAGCGKLGYSPDVVIDCFLRAQRDVVGAAGIQVYILAFENSILRTFKNGISSASFVQRGHSFRPSSPETPQRQAWSSHGTPAAADIPQTPETRQSNVDKVLVFEVTAVGLSTVEKAKKQLHNDLKQLVGEEYVVSEVIEIMGTEVEGAILKSATPYVRVKIDKDANRIVITGKKSQLRKTVIDVRAVLSKEEEREQDYLHCKATRGVEQTLRRIGNSHEIRYPDYWKLDVKAGTTGGRTKQLFPDPAKHELESTSKEFADVSRILMGTWDAGKVGLGSDASGLQNVQYRNIKVRKIWRLENPEVYSKYDVTRKRLCRDAAERQIPSVNGLETEDEISTAKLGLSQLDRARIPQINEYYVLHGAPESVIRGIERTGFDFRLNERGMMGKGVYFAESSTKADQYADDSSKRIGLNQSLYMFVAKVLLGNVYVSRQVKSYKRPPCSKSDCLKDTCSDPSHGRAFDSIIATHRPAPNDKQRLLFREFVVYDLAQSYPEYLVEYERLP